MKTTTKQRELIGWTIVAAVEPTGFFNSFNPSIWDIKSGVVANSADQTAQNVARLRSGYTPALVLSLALGAGLSFLADSAVPFLAAAASSAYMVHAYEMALPGEHRLLGSWFGSDACAAAYKIVRGFDDVEDQSEGWKGKHYPLRLPI